MSTSRVSRRYFLQIVGLASTAAAVAACGSTPVPTAAPTTAPTKAPAAATTAPTTAPAAATAAPTAVATKGAEATKAPAAATTAPTAAAAAGAPTKFAEAPMLADQVKAGKLPPVDQRLPKDPLVVTPVEGVGAYGGKWKTITTGSLYQEWYSMFEPMNTFTPDFKGLVPNLAKEWKYGDSGKTLTITLRTGIRWSDGTPFTTDDIMFWWQDVILNDELTPAKPTSFMRAGEMAKIEKIDDYNFKITWTQPNGMFEEQLPNHWMYLPKKYLSQFHTKYVQKADLDALVAKEGFKTWTELFGAKNTNFNNPGCPYLTAWVATNTVDKPVHTFVRNAYYWKLDTAGNQLPYLDGKDRTLVSDAQAALLKAIAGDIDFEWHSAPGGLNNRPTVVENMTKGDYHIVELVSPGTGYGTIFFNYAHKDPVLKDLFNKLDFRIALSVAINRNEINDLLYKGLATVGMATCAVKSPWYDPKYSTTHAEYDVAQANKLLDGLGLTKKDSEGFRLRSDGQRLSMVNTAFTPWPTENVQIQELVKDYWKAVGVEMVVKPMADKLWVPYVHGLSHDIASYSANLGFAGNPPVQRETFCTEEGNQHWSPQWGLWYKTGGKEGLEPPADIQTLQKLQEQVLGETSADKRITLQKQALDLHAKNVWMIGIVAEPDAGRYGVCKNNFHNVPPKDYPLQPPQVVPTAQFYIKS